MRLRFIHASVVIFMIAGMLLSPNLWTGVHNYPSISMFNMELPYWFDDGLWIASMVAFAAGWIWKRSRIWTWLAVISLGCLVLLDLTRLQVWVYHMVILLLIIQHLPFLYRKYRSFDHVLSALQLSILVFYLWSGINKLNLTFFEYVAPYVAAPLSHQFEAILYFDEMVKAAPFLDLFFVVGLMLRWTRKPTVIVLTLYHLIAVLLVGVFGYNNNSVIIPWNLMLVLVVLLAFWGTKGLQPNNLKWLTRPSFALIFLLIGVGPLLSYWDITPKNMSFDAYSGRPTYKHFPLVKTPQTRIPTYLDKHTTAFGDTLYVDQYSWAMEEMNVPPNDEAWIWDRTLLRTKKMLKAK